MALFLGKKVHPRFTFLSNISLKTIINGNVQKMYSYDDLVTGIKNLQRDKIKKMKYNYNYFKVINMTSQAKYYGKFLEPAKEFSTEINEKIKSKFNLEDKTYEKNIFEDENNCEWKITKDYSLGILEITFIFKKIVNNKPIYKSGWVYDKCNTNFDTHHLIQIENLYFLISNWKNLLL
jgi:hypothetical protein